VILQYLQANYRKCKVTNIILLNVGANYQLPVRFSVIDDLFKSFLTSELAKSAGTCALQAVFFSLKNMKHNSFYRSFSDPKNSFTFEA
jgi:hypothetical protein